MKNVKQCQAQKLTGGLWTNTAPTMMAQGTLTHTRTIGQYREYVGHHVTHTVTTENQKKKEKENKTNTRCDTSTQNTGGGQFSLGRERKW